VNTTWYCKYSQCSRWRAKTSPETYRADLE